MRLRNRSGFTLLELLVSFGLLTILVIALAMIFRQGTAAFKKGYDNTQVYQSARIALDRMVRELSGAYTTYSEAGAPVYTFVGTESGSKTGTAGPEAYCIVPDVREDNYLGAAEVGFWLRTTDADLANRFNLMRYVHTIGESDKGDAAKISNFGKFTDGASELLASNVVSLAISYYDGTNWSNNWTSSYAAGLPRAVKITIKTADDDTIRKYKDDQTALENHAKTFVGIARMRNRTRAVDQLKIDTNAAPEYP